MASRFQTLMPVLYKIYSPSLSMDESKINRFFLATFLVSLMIVDKAGAYPSGLRALSKYYTSVKKLGQVQTPPIYVAASVIDKDSFLH